MPYGNDGTLAINFQDSYGLPEVASLNFMPLNDENFSPKIEDLVSAEMRGVFDEGGSYPGKTMVDGEMNIDADMNNLGAIARAVLGPATVVVSGSVNTHTFKPRTSDFSTKVLGDPMTILVDFADGGSAQQYYDMVGTTMEFGISAGELTKLKLGAMGGKYTQIAAVAASFSTDSKMPWSQTTFSMSGAAVDDLMDINVKIDEKGEPKYVMDGTVNAGYVKRNGTRSIEVSGTLLFNDQVELAEFIAQSERKLQLTFSSGVEVQSGYNESITVILPAFKYTAYDVSLTGPEQLAASFSGKAKYHSGSATALELTLVNSHPAY